MTAGAEPPENETADRVQESHASRNAVVLVHGAWHDGWCWEAVGERLSAAGVEWSAPDLPLHSFQGDAEVVRTAVEAFGGRPVTLVGHSRAGRVISFASFGSPQVERLVYVAADVPRFGERGMRLDKPQRGAFDGRIALPDGYSDFDRIAALDVFYNGVPRALAEEAASHLRPTKTDDVEDVSGVGVGWPDRATTYVVTAQDRAIHPDDQRRVAGLLDEVIEVDACHCVMLSDPDALAEIILART